MSVSKDVTNSCIDFVTLIAAEGYQFRKSFEAGAKKSSLSPMPAFVMTEEHGVNSLSELVDVLKSAAAEGQAVIRGKQLPPEDIRERNEKGKKNISSRPSMGGDERQAVYRRNGHVFEEKPHHWVCMDLDSVKVEGVAFDVNNPEPAIAAAIEQELGDKFYIASYAWCLSSSAGLPEKPGVRVHLWFWMAEPMGRAEWDAWWLWRMHQLGRPVTQAQIAALDVGDFEESSKVRREVESCTDKALFRQVQPHYVAPPIFKNEADNPVSGERWGFVEGVGEDKVYLDLEEIRAFADKHAAAHKGGTARGGKGSGEAPTLTAEGKNDFAWNHFNLKARAINRTVPISKAIEMMPSVFSFVEGDKVKWQGCSDDRSCTIKDNDSILDSWNENNWPVTWPDAGIRPVSAYELLLVFHPDFGDGDACALSDDELKAQLWEWIVKAAPSVLEELGRIEAQARPLPEQAAQIAKEYPPFKIGARASEYRKTDDGWRLVLLPHKRGESDETEEDKPTYLWSPLTFDCVETSAATGEETVVFKIRSANGSPVLVPVSRAKLASPQREVVGELLRYGWLADSDAQRIFCKVVGGATTSARIKALPKRGWNEQAGGRLFAAPDGTIIAPGGVDVEGIRLSRNQVMPLDAARRGTLEGWRATIDAALADQAHDAWALGVAAGLSGPLVPFLSEHAMPGLWFYGDSRVGKTTGVRAAVGVWANPYPLGGADKLFNTLSGTINATELLAAKANGTILALDEGNTQAEQQQKGLAQFLYTLASGEGKKRMSQDASGERPGHFWQTFGVFSSEETPQNASERANRGAKMARGVGARILNVHVEKLAGGETFNQALGRDFGHAGPAFVSGLVERGLCESELRRRFDVLRDALTKGASGDVAATAAGTLAILWLAGILAYDFDLIGESSRDAIEVAVKRLWASFCTDQGAASEIETEAAVLDWVARNINNFIPERDRGCRVFGPDGALGWSEPDPEDPGRVIIYLQSGSLAKAAGGTREAQRVARDLRKRGRLLKGDNGRGMKRRVKWADGRPECYALWVEAPDVGESTSPDNQVGMF